MATTARVIFRGLTAFIWNEQAQMVAVMVNHSQHRPDAHPAPPHRHHDHLPRLSWLGHRGRQPSYGPPEPFAGTLSFRWSDELQDRAQDPAQRSAAADRQFYPVERSPSVIEYIPSFEQLGADGDEVEGLVQGAELFQTLNAGEIEGYWNGTVTGLVQCGAASASNENGAWAEAPAKTAVTDLVTFYRSARRPGGDATPKFPQPIRFLGTPDPEEADQDREWIALGSELTVLFTHPEDDVEFIIESTENPQGQSTPKVALQSWWNEPASPRPTTPRPPPSTRPGHPAEHDLWPADIEVLITNFVGRMDEPVPFNAHYQAFFDLHQSPPGAPNPGRFNDLVQAYRERHGDLPLGALNWGDELQEHMEELYEDGLPRYPFPYIADPRDPLGNPIKDWDDRPRCPLIRGGKDGA